MADLEGVLEPPFAAKIFNFHGEFSEKSRNIDNRSYKINKSHPPPPFVNLNPPSRHPEFAPGNSGWII